MKTKLKKISIPFILVMIFYLISYKTTILIDFGIFTPHIGLFYISGLLFGPYGALGAVMANVVSDLIDGNTIIEILISNIICFGVSLLGYKIWYSGLNRGQITKPKLDNINHVDLFLLSIILCGSIYAVFHGNYFNLIIGDTSSIPTQIYLMNFINTAFVTGIIGIWISKKIDFVHTPQTSKKPVNKKLYNALFLLLMISLILSTIALNMELDNNIIIISLILMAFSLFAYLTKPFEYKLETSNSVSILEKVITFFLTTTLIIATIGVIISTSGSSFLFINVGVLDDILPALPLLLMTDIIIILFFIPEIFIIKYIEKRIISPIKSFSEIEEFIKENERIEAEGLVNIYSEYINQTDEIGKLARSYTELINHNNEYIKNIAEIEGEKERIKTELDIATKIQAANLPTKAIKNKEYIVNGYSKPAKEVGGDFFDYYEIDDDYLAIIIGDASGKGVPAALLSTITQAIIKQLLNHEKDPSEVLYQLNNQLCEHNSETMFITLWLGIYNKTTRKFIFSNAGHNPPLIKEKDEFEYMQIDSGIVLGIMEDYEYVTEEITDLKEIILYTDGITDANNNTHEMYGEDRLLEFFNGFKSGKDPIKPLLEKIGEFTQDEEQYDDMTLLYLKIKE